MSEQIDYKESYHRILKELVQARERVTYLERRCGDLEYANTTLKTFNESLLEQRDTLNAQLNAAAIQQAQQARGEGIHHA